MQLRTIVYQSPDYAKMIALRMDILRRPLGLSFRPEQLAAEIDDVFIIALSGDETIGCCVLTARNMHQVQLRQMAVHENWQGKGVGRSLVEFAEKCARERGFIQLIMHARQSAIGFYEKMGYVITSAAFEEVTLPHYEMQKSLE